MEQGMNTTSCNLCGSRDGQIRRGRLGRYACTCEACESRRGTHLRATERGYTSALVSV
ncbi:MAG: hypothetical protein AAGE98_06250 [Actinomycetota bacterium]